MAMPRRVELLAERGIVARRGRPRARWRCRPVSHRQVRPSIICNVTLKPRKNGHELGRVVVPVSETSSGSGKPESLLLAPACSAMRVAKPRYGPTCFVVAASPRACWTAMRPWQSSNTSAPSRLKLRLAGRVIDHDVVASGPMPRERRIAHNGEPRIFAAGRRCRRVAHDGEQLRRYLAKLDLIARVHRSFAAVCIRCGRCGPALFEPWSVRILRRAPIHRVSVHLDVKAHRSGHPPYIWSVSRTIFPSIFTTGRRLRLAARSVSAAAIDATSLDLDDR